MTNNIATLADLLPLTIDQLPGIDSYTWTQHSKEALRQFCLDSKAFIERGTMNIVADQVDYTITPAYDDVRINSIAELWIRTDDDVTDDLPGTQQDEDNYSFTKPATLTLSQSIKPSVSVTSGILAVIVLVPEHQQTGANTIDVNFLNDYTDAIIARMLYTLKMMPKQRWTDTQMATFHLQKYNEWVTEAIADVELAGKTQPDGFTA